MAAARVAVLLHLFAVKAQQVGADIVDIVDIVAVFFEAVDQRARIFRLPASGNWPSAPAISSSKLMRCWSKTIPFSACSESLRLAIPIP
jgi:hypothetical protein